MIVIDCGDSQHCIINATSWNVQRLSCAVRVQPGRVVVTDRCDVKHSSTDKVLVDVRQPIVLNIKQSQTVHALVYTCVWCCRTGFGFVSESTRA